MGEQKRFVVADFSEIPALPCPCGMSRRAFIDSSDGCASFHVVEIKKDAQLHYHKNHIEIYYILEGAGVMELDGEKVPVKPGVSVFIKKYCRHRAIGKLKIVNVSLPVFDPEDEYFD
jgi:mannose-6-phosphate isomerase-like protein (cupin superfamily)